jgi:hypothetical protein
VVKRKPMSDSDRGADAEIILMAYADKVKEAFQVFAEALNAGQPQKACTERFVRALGLVKRARDLALEAASGALVVETAGDERTAEEAPGEGLSEEDRALIEAALSGTTGVAKPVRLR